MLKTLLKLLYALYLSYLKYKLEKLLLGNIDTKILLMTHDLQSFYDIDKFLVEIDYACEEKFGKQTCDI